MKYVLVFTNPRNYITFSFHKLQLKYKLNMFGFYKIKPKIHSNFFPHIKNREFALHNLKSNVNQVYENLRYNLQNSQIYPYKISDGLKNNKNVSWFLPEKLYEFLLPSLNSFSIDRHYLTLAQSEQYEKSKKS